MSEKSRIRRYPQLHTIWLARAVLELLALTAVLAPYPWIRSTARRRLAGEPAGAPGGLEVVAADQAVEVEDLAREVQAGNQPALERLGIDLVERDAAAGDLGLFESERARDRQRQPFERGDEPLAFVAREVRAHPIGGDRRGRHHAFGQPARELGGQEGDQGRRPWRLEAWSRPVELLARDVGDQVEPERQPLGVVATARPRG